MSNPDQEEEKEIISNTEQVELKRYGSSDVLHIPAAWRHSFPQLRGKVIFDAHIERDSNGRFCLVFQKAHTQIQAEVTTR